MSTTENTRYREVAEYATTVEAARNAAGTVTPADCLAYEVDQYEAAYKEQIYSEQLYFDEDAKQELPKLLSKEHPDYPQRLAERKAEAERELSKIYALHGQELADQWATEHSKARDKRLLLACLLKESAHRLLDGYAGYLTLVGLGRLVPGTVLPGFLFSRLIASEKKPVSWTRRMKERSTVPHAYYGINCNTGPYADLDRGLIAAGAGAAELAHFKQLLAEFYEAEQAPAAAPSEPATSDPAGPTTIQLSLRQVALLYVYEGKVIPKAADDIARHYGHQSGAKLYEKYLTFSQRAGRVGDEVSGQKLAPMITAIKGLIPHLNGTALQQAESELKTLEARK